MNTNTKKTSQSALPRSYEISNGPSTDRIFDAIKYVYDRFGGISVDFDIIEGYTMPKDDPGCVAMLLKVSDIKIIGVSHEDGSGHSLILRGYCTVRGQSETFQAYYNARTRKGHFTLVD